MEFESKSEFALFLDAYIKNLLNRKKDLIVCCYGHSQNGMSYQALKIQNKIDEELILNAKTK